MQKKNIKFNWIYNVFNYVDTILTGLSFVTFKMNKQNINDYKNIQQQIIKLAGYFFYG